MYTETRLEPEGVLAIRSTAFLRNSRIHRKATCGNSLVQVALHGVRSIRVDYVFAAQASLVRIQCLPNGTVWPYHLVRGRIPRVGRSLACRDVFGAFKRYRKVTFVCRRTLGLLGMLEHIERGVIDGEAAVAANDRRGLNSLVRVNIQKGEHRLLGVRLPDTAPEGRSERERLWYRCGP